MINSNKSKAALTIFIILFSCASFVSANPSILTVTGDIVHNSETIQISGIDFGTKAIATPYFYDDFESGENGGVIVGQKGAVGDTAWVEYSSYGKVKYSNSDSYGKGTLSAHKYDDGNTFMNAGIPGLNSVSAYLSYRYKWNASGTNWEGAVYKLSRITSQGGLYSETPSCYPQYQPKYNWAYDGYNNGDAHSGNDSFPPPSQNEWHRAEIFMTLSDPAGASNGQVKTWYDLVQNLSDVNVVTRVAAASEKRLDSFILPFDVANNGAQMYNFWADNVYFDLTQSRVEVGDNVDFRACTNREIQIPLDWSDDGKNIRIRFNQGSFEENESVFLFVVDSLGNPSPGFPISIGSVDAETGKPEAPSVSIIE